MGLTYAAVILAGGRGARLGGVAKPLVVVRGRTMLDAALTAAGSASSVVVVGDVPVPPGVLQTLEDPPFGGPAAGLAAGLAALTHEDPWVLVLASDVPGVDAAVPELLMEAARVGPEVDGICFHDEDGHPQWMLALYRTDALRRAVGGHPDHRLLTAPAARSAHPDHHPRGRRGHRRLRHLGRHRHRPPEDHRMTDLEHPRQRWLDWVASASDAVGVDAADIDIVEIHLLSKHVAHRLERPLAPVSTFILGLALGAAQASGGVTDDTRATFLTRILDTLPEEPTSAS